MGTYLNPGSQRFQMAVNSEIYIDKTELIRYLNTVVNTNQRYVSVSRPRRFGKSITADMICAYYGGGDGSLAFQDKKLAGYDDWDQYLNQFDVIRLVMTEFFKKDVEVIDSIQRLTKRVLDELEEAYPEVKYDPSDIFYSMDKFCQKRNKQFVIVIDEWDAVFRTRKEDKDGQTRYLNFLRDWLKDKTYVALAYMTGILPIKKYGEHSALNMFGEYSIISPMQLAPYTGFTEEEVRALCREYGRDYGKLKEWYDGYDVSDVIPPDPGYEIQNLTGREPQPARYSIYSPLSVVNAVSTGIIQNYWNKTETYEALAEYIRMNFDGLKDAVALMMDGGRVKINISKYQNDMTSFAGRDDVFSLLVHLGYLGYDTDTKEVFVPNKEILDEFKNSTGSSEWADTFQSFRLSQELLKATWELNERKVAELLEYFHDMAENKTYHCEAALSYAVQMAYYAAQKYYTTIQELDSGKGYCDIVYLPSPQYPDKPALLIELKYDKTAETAAGQIRSRNYPQRLEHYKGNLLVVSVNYNRDMKNTDEGYKRHSCMIEKA